MGDTVSSSSQVSPVVMETLLVSEAVSHIPGLLCLQTPCPFSGNSMDEMNVTG